MKIFSDKQYDDFLNANTLEDFLNLRNNILNENNDNISFDEGLICVRMLSSNEYDNYIMINDLNGAITSGNVNVWNHLTQGVSYYGITSYDGSCPSYTSWRTDLLKNQNKIPITQNYVEGWWSGYGGIRTRDSFATAYCYSELVSNNTSNIIRYKFRTLTFDCQGFNATSYYENYYGSVTITEKQFTKSIASETYVIQTPPRRSGDVKVYVQVTIINGVSFRPVFQYIDNKKSKNVYC